MIYHRLHGSVARFYRDVPMEPSIPDEWDQYIPDQTKDFLQYGTQSEPHNHSMLQICVEEEELRLLRVCCAEGRMSNATTKFFHKQLMDITPQRLLEGFDEILNIPFMTEVQMNCIWNGEAPGLPGYSWSGPRRYLNVSAKVLRAVLYGMVDRWRFGSPPVVIEVPAGEDYDSYTYQAVRTIYACLPAAMRGIVGFMTYANPNQAPLNVALLFVPESENYEGAIRLDWETDDIEQILQCELPTEIKEMLNKIVGLFQSADTKAYDDYLRQILEDLERVMPMKDLRCSHYVNYLRETKLLDVPVDTVEGFRKWIKFADNYPEKNISALQIRLRDVLVARMTEDVLCEHVFREAEEAICLADFKEKVSVIDAVCGMSQTVSELVKKETERYFAQKLARVEEFAHVQSLLKEISGAENESGIYPNQEMTEAFMERCNTRWEELSVHKLEEFKQNTLKKLEEILGTENAPDRLMERGKRCLKELGDFAKSDELLLSATEQNNAVGPVFSDWAKKLRSRLQHLVQLRSDLPEPLTAVAKRGEENRLDELQSFLSNMQTDRLKRELNVTDLQKILDDSKRKLNHKYAGTAEARREKLAEAFVSQNHFERIEKFQEMADRMGSITEEENKQAVNRIQENRPATFRDYRRDFERCYMEPLSHRKIRTLNERIRGEIEADLEAYRQKDCEEIVVLRKGLVVLVTMLSEEMSAYRDFIGKEPQHIRLRGEVGDGWGELRQYSTDAYNTTNLRTALEALIGGQDRAGLTMLGEDSLKEVLKFLNEVCAVDEHLVPGMLDALFDVGMRQAARTLLERHLVEAPVMDPKTRQQLLLCCERHNQGRLLRELIPVGESYQSLREEVEQIFGTDEKKAKKKLDLREVLIGAVCGFLACGAIVWGVSSMKNRAPGKNEDRETLPPVETTEQTVPIVNLPEEIPVETIVLPEWIETIEDDLSGQKKLPDGIVPDAGGMQENQKILGWMNMGG